MKKFFPYILIIIGLVGLFSLVAKTHAASDPFAPYDRYHFLAPLPCTGSVEGGCEDGLQKSFDPTQKNNLGVYLNMMIRIFIGICAVLAVVMIVMGGIEYMTSELISSKEAGKEKIRNALLGLLIALGAYTILFTINPDILKTDSGSLSPQVVTLPDLGAEGSGPSAPINNAELRAIGFNCPGSGGKAAVASIAQQFAGSVTYSNSARNTHNSTTLFEDCSSFVGQVYSCAGLANPGSTTSVMFPGGATPVNGATFDFNTLHSGDLVGWKANPPTERSGHVMIYIGNGQIIDTQPSGTMVRSLDSFKKRVTFVKWPN